MGENAIQFYKELITRHIESVKDSLSDTKYRIYMAIVDSCDDLEKLKDMADFDMQNDFLAYSREINDKLGEYNTTIDELESIYNGEYETIDLDDIAMEERKEAEENRVAEVSSTVDKLINNFDEYENIIEKLMTMQTERDEEEYGMEYRIDVDYEDNNEDILEEELPEIEESGLSFENEEYTEEILEEELTELEENRLSFNCEEESESNNLDDNEEDEEEFTQEELDAYFDTNETDGIIYYNEEELEEDYDEPEDTITFEDIDRELEYDEEEYESTPSEEIDYAEDDSIESEEEYDEDEEDSISFDSEDGFDETEEELYGENYYSISDDDFDEEDSDYYDNYENVESISDTLEQFDIADDDFDDDSEDTLDEGNSDGGIEFEEEIEEEPDFEEILSKRPSNISQPKRQVNYSYDERNIQNKEKVGSSVNVVPHTNNTSERKQPTRQFNTQTEHGREAQRVFNSIGRVISRVERKKNQIKKDTANYFNDNGGDDLIDF